MTTIEEIRASARAYVRENFLYARPDFDLKDDQPLMEAGVIDSMGVMELIDFIQMEFGVVVEDDEITEDNLGTLSAIARYVAAKRSGSRSEV